MAGRKHIFPAAGWLVVAAAVATAGLLASCDAPVQRAAETQRFNDYLRQHARDLKFDPNSPLTMNRCRELALTNSLDLKVQELTLRLQDDQVALALTQGLPSGTLQYTNTKRSNENIGSVAGFTTVLSDQHQREFTVQGMIPVLDFGLTYYSYRIAADQRRQQRLLLERAKQLLRRDVEVAYAEHAGALRQERLSETAYEAASEVLRVAGSLERAHLTVHADTILVEAALAQAALDLSTARQRVEETHLILAQLMTLPPGVTFTIDSLLPALPPAPDGALISAYEAGALARRPELTVQDLQRQVANSSVWQQASALFPHLNLVGGYDRTSSTMVANPAFFMGGFEITHSLLNGGATLVQVDQARKMQDVQKEQSLLTALGVLYEVELGALRVQEAGEIIKAAAVLEKSRREALDRIISLYKEGLEDEAGAARSLADLTAQATALDTAQTNYLVAWYELEAAALPENLPGATSQPASAPAGVKSPATAPAAWQGGQAIPLLIPFLSHDQPKGSQP